ncbi:MAG: TlpA disulfide reductase family protein [Anaerovoracaceae bacterium]|jgi:thiol-disulfide isomerase/thioredoxin
MKRIITVIAILTLSLLLYSCGGGEDVNLPADDPSNSGKSEGVDNSWPFDIETTTLDGDSFTNEDLSENTLTVLNIWATWCPPCVKELPHLQEVNELFKDRGVEVIGVMQDGVNNNLQPDNSVIKKGKKLLKDSGVEYRVILPDEAISNQFINTMQYFPTTFFLNSSGQVVKVVTGAKDKKGWEKTINEVLNDIR